MTQNLHWKTRFFRKKNRFLCPQNSLPTATLLLTYFKSNSVKSEELYEIIGRKYFTELSKFPLSTYDSPCLPIILLWRNKYNFSR